MAQAKTNNVSILSVVWFNVFPAKYGGQKAVALFLQHLAHHTKLQCLCSNDNVGDTMLFPVSNSLPTGKLQIINPFAWRRVFRLVKQERISHLLLEFPYYGLAGLLCKHIYGTKLLVTAHNVEYRRFREQGKRWWPFLYLLERHTLRGADAIFFKTPEDLSFAQLRFKLNEEKLSVIPYGVFEAVRSDDKKCRETVRRRHEIAPDEKFILFAGTLDYLPNAEAVANIKKQLVPLLKKRLHSFRVVICGRNKNPAFQYLTELVDDWIVFAGDVDEIETYFLAADLFINPVLKGGGIQTKTMDALSYHLTVVSFAGRAAGIEGAGVKVLRVPDGDWEAFASAICAGLEVQQPTPAAFFVRHNWRSIAANAYQKILNC